MSENPIFERIKARLMRMKSLFMKGTPVFPQCGFSSVCVQVLSSLGIQFKGLMVEDEEVREGIKPTQIGQLFSALR